MIILGFIFAIVYFIGGTYLFIRILDIIQNEFNFYIIDDTILIVIFIILEIAIVLQVFHSCYKPLY